MADVVHMNADDENMQIAYDPKVYEKVLEEVAKEQKQPLLKIDYTKYVIDVDKIQEDAIPMYNSYCNGLERFIHLEGLKISMQQPDGTWKELPSVKVSIDNEKDIK